VVIWLFFKSDFFKNQAAYSIIDWLLSFDVLDWQWRWSGQQQFRCRVLVIESWNRIEMKCNEMKDKTRWPTGRERVAFDSVRWHSDGDEPGMRNPECGWPRPPQALLYFYLSLSLSLFFSFLPFISSLLSCHPFFLLLFNFSCLLIVSFNCKMGCIYWPC